MSNEKSPLIIDLKSLIAIAGKVADAIGRIGVVSPSLRSIAMQAIRAGGAESRVMARYGGHKLCYVLKEGAISPTHALLEHYLGTISHALFEIADEQSDIDDRECEVLARALRGAAEGLGEMFGETAGTGPVATSAVTKAAHASVKNIARVNRFDRHQKDQLRKRLERWREKSDANAGRCVHRVDNGTNRLEWMYPLDAVQDEVHAVRARPRAS